MPSLVTGACLSAAIMAFTACLRFARALPLNGVSGGQQRYAFVGQGARVGIPCRHLKDRRTAVQSLSCTAARSTGSRSAGAVSPAERIYQLAGREFEIGKPSVLAKVGATTYCLYFCIFVGPCTHVLPLWVLQRMFFQPNQSTHSIFELSEFTRIPGIWQVDIEPVCSLQLRWFCCLSSGTWQLANCALPTDDRRQQPR